MTISPTDLASLLCSKLCHDLLSPVGALTNGLELLADETDPEMRQRCFELLEQSAKTSADKLRFFRLAFGAAGGFGDEVDSSEPHALIAALTGDKIELDWQVEAAKLPKPAVKMLLNLAQIGIEALVRGGKLEVGAEVTGEACEIALRASGDRVVFDPVIGRALDGSLAEGEITSRTAAPYMLHLLAQESGGGLQHAASGDALVMGAVLPLG
ncbi:MAG TPA: histidine phosphotransferase family protein [Sphingomonadaceae bacterium]|nr:histidine phosphotransferase family protein [Sphingomonadaceae bacterium]